MRRENSFTCNGINSLRESSYSGLNCNLTNFLRYASSLWIASSTGIVSSATVPSAISFAFCNMQSRRLAFFIFFFSNKKKKKKRQMKKEEKDSRSTNFWLNSIVLKKCGSYICLSENTKWLLKMLTSCRHTL